PVNDPSSITAEFDLRYLPLEQIASIEVLKSGLSTLYGTNAAAGVIDIRLKQAGETKKIGGLINAQAGSFNTFRQHLQLSGKEDKLSYYASGTNVRSAGFSAAISQDPNDQFDQDGFSRQNGLLKLGYELDKSYAIELHTAYEKFWAEYDAFEFTDADNRQELDQIRVGIHQTYSHSNGKLTSYLQYQQNNRDFQDAFPSTFNSSQWQFDINHKLNFTEWLSVFYGLNIQQHAYTEQEIVAKDSANFALVDPYLSTFLDFKNGFNLHAGLRLNHHSVYDTRLLYNINPSWHNTFGQVETKLFAAVSTSYITPSLFQLYSFFGNKNLEPELYTNYETGLSVKIKKFDLQAVTFRRDEQDPVDFVALFDTDGNYIGGRYQNVARTRKVEGLEFNGSFQINQNTGLSAYFTHQQTDRPESFYRIPNRKYGFNFFTRVDKWLDISLRYNYIGERRIFDFFNFTERSLDAYHLFDLNISKEFLKGSLRADLAINNLLDAEFIAIYGFTTMGRNFNAGLTYKF
ncbi:MAG TPA: TonB-dependent receptor, partial [Cyclobacteriaceae bacterium]|nr:TonB-dependent receptor [Cyclobacteriaceae bacterium]